VFGHVAEGLDVVRAINQLHLDERGRPFRNCRIKSVAVLDDPFPDPTGLDLLVPAQSPTPLALDDRPDADEKDPLAGLPEEEVERIRAAAAAKSRAVVLEMIGDLPDVDVAPPDNVLFVCKLNPATVDEDLELIFSRFGVVKKAEVIRDHKTGDSLNYAFIEFEQREACEQVPAARNASSGERFRNTRVRAGVREDEQCHHRRSPHPVRLQPVRHEGVETVRGRSPIIDAVFSIYRCCPNRYRLQLREKAVKARQERAGGVDLGGGLQLKGGGGGGAKYEMLVGHEFGAPPTRAAGGGGSGGRDWAGRDREGGRSDSRAGGGGGGDRGRERRRSRSRSRERDRNRGRDWDRHRR
jgi:peptidyl-prolyl cis-trans isomerase-like 4